MKAPPLDTLFFHSAAYDDVLESVLHPHRDTDDIEISSPNRVYQPRRFTAVVVTGRIR